MNLWYSIAFIVNELLTQLFYLRLHEQRAMLIGAKVVH